MLYGWTGKRLVADLTQGKTWVEAVPETWRRDFIGGRGVNSRTLYEEVKPGTDPLGPENVLLFGVGPADGTMVPASGRYTVTALSPLTLVGQGSAACFGDSNSGGFFGPELKYAGYDQVVIRGRAEKPVYLFIDDQGAQIRPAQGVWGKDVWEADVEIRKEIKEPLAQIALIGPAGENLVRYASILNNLSRAAGKCGMGAAMGSKNLKAVAVRGKKPVRVANPKRLQELATAAIEELAKDSSAQVYAAYGTSSLLAVHQRLGRLATRNYQNTQFEGWKNLASERFTDFWIKSKGCFACPEHCGHFYRVEEEGEYKGVLGEGPEYATIASFGSKIGNDDPAVIMAINNLCNQMGIDTINTGSAISWAMECYQRGIITQQEADGLDLTWGNMKVVVELVERIAKRQGDFANLLGEGAYRASKKLGRGSEYYVVHVKAQDPGLSDPRVAPAWGTGYAVASRGGDHLRSLPTGESYFSPQEAEQMFGSAEAITPKGIKGKGRLVKWSEDERAVADSLEICKFIVRTSMIWPCWLGWFLAAVTGVELSDDEIMRTGERIVNVERSFNLRQGLVPADDTLSKRFTTEPIPDGPFAGRVLDLTTMVKEYYEARGWSYETGLPKAGLLEGLGLGEMAADVTRIRG